MCYFKQDLIKEKEELDKKMVELSDFVNTPLFNDLSVVRQQRINTQYKGMEIYSNALKERIDNYEITDDE